MKKLYKILKQKGLTKEQEELILREINFVPEGKKPEKEFRRFTELYYENDFEKILQMSLPDMNPVLSLQTLDELLRRDKLREKDGFPRRIRLGKLVKQGKNGKGEIIIVPTTTEPKFYHDTRVTEEQDENEMGETGGSGEEAEGEVLGEKPVDQQGEGAGTGAGEGGEESHDITQEAFDLGKVLTEQFELPNLKDKGHKRSLMKYQYDLTDKNRGFGQLLDKKATLKKVLDTNIILGNVSEDGEVDLDKLIINPKDQVFRILSKEKVFESQALVFFVRDYSGSMQGDPTEVVTSQHLMIYSWLMYQYQNRVETRFVLHDTKAKEVEDFYTYYRSQVAGGTQVAPAFELINKIIDENNYAKDYNIYVFYGTDGDDWDSSGKKTIEEIKKLLPRINRLGITIAKNSWTTANQTTVEKYIEKSGLLKSKSDIIKIDSFSSTNAPEDRIIKGIKKLIE